MIAIKAKSYGVLYSQSSSIDLMKHLVIGQHQKVSNFSALHWSPYGSLFPLVSFRSHEGSTFTEKDQNKLNY